MVAASAGPRIARLGDRLLAQVLDGALLAAAFAIIGMWAAARWGGATESGFELTGKAAGIVMAAVGGIGFLYFWLQEAAFGATLGKGIAGVRVLREDGKRCDVRSSLLRNLLRVVDALGVYLVGFLIAVFSRSRQRLGDHVANTVVVERDLGTLALVALVALWLAGIGGGIWGAYRIHSTIPIPATPDESAAAEAAPSSAPLASAPAAGDLEIVNFAFLERERGPERLEARYQPGDTVYTKYDLVGFTTNAEGRVDLRYVVVPLDPGGAALYPPWKDELRRAVGNVTRIENTYKFDLPPYAPGGTYRTRITVHDAVKNRDAEIAPTFTVKGTAIEPATSLEFRDCRVSLSKDGPEARPAVIRAGQTIYTSCKVAGMQFREDRPDVEIALQVMGPDGKALLDSPDWMRLGDATPYHPPTHFVSIWGHVTTPSDGSKGMYSEKLTATDKIGGATATYEASFEIR